MRFWCVFDNDINYAGFFFHVIYWLHMCFLWRTVYKFLENSNIKLFSILLLTCKLFFIYSLRYAKPSSYTYLQILSSILSCLNFLKAIYPLRTKSWWLSAFSFVICSFGITSKKRLISIRSQRLCLYIRIFYKFYKFFS